MLSLPERCASHQVRPVAAWLGIALAGTMVATCVRGSLPTRELYRLRGAPAVRVATTTTDGTASDPRITDAPIRVEPYETPGVYGAPQIVYRVDAVRYGTYPNREWALPLGSMLATLTAEALRADGAGRGVEEADAAAPNGGLAWRGTVREFEEVNRGQEVFAVVRLEASLVRASDDSVLWRGDARVERPVLPATLMTAVVDSLSSSAATVVRELVRRAAPTLGAAVAKR